VYERAQRREVAALSGYLPRALAGARRDKAEQQVAESRLIDAVAPRLVGPQHHDLARVGVEGGASPQRGRPAVQELVEKRPYGANIHAGGGERLGRRPTVVVEERAATRRAWPDACRRTRPDPRRPARPAAPRRPTSPRPARHRANRLLA